MLRDGRSRPGMLVVNCCSHRRGISMLKGTPFVCPLARSKFCDTSRLWAKRRLPLPSMRLWLLLLLRLLPRRALKVKSLRLLREPLFRWEL